MNILINLFYKHRIHSNSMNKTKSNVIELYSYLSIYSDILKLTEKISLTQESKLYILKDTKKSENNIPYIEYINN